MKFLKPNIILIILGVVVATCIFFYFRRVEGFETQGTVPGATQASAITKDTPGATSTNPTVAVPQSPDILDIQERLKNFSLLAADKIPSETNLKGAELNTVVALDKEAPLLQGKLVKALASFDTSGFTVEEFKGLRARIDSAIGFLRGSKIVAPNASPVKVQAVMDILGKFSILTQQKRPENTDLPESVKAEVMALRDGIPDLEQRLLAALAQSDIITFTDVTLATLKTRLKKALLDLQKATVVGAGAGTAVEKTVITPAPSMDASYAALVANEPQPTVAAGPVGVITLQELKDLVKRIGEESLRLERLRSTGATITAKIQQLTKLKADLGDIITKVEREQMKLEDVPITQSAATQFLMDISKDNGPLPPLIVPTSSLSPSVAASSAIASYAGIPEGEAAVQKLLEAAKDLRWSMEVRLEYDPQLKTRDAMLGRIENIIKNLSTLSISESAIPPNVHNSYLNEIKNMQRTFQTDMPSYRGGDVGAMSRLGTQDSRTPQGAPEPSASDLSTAQGAGFGPQVNTFPTGEISPDVYIRPGVVMTDEMIRHRASAASFIPAAGGADYKQRALEICRQVKSANLGGTQTFGCIENPDAVGPNYDWKGNYTMVCNRLGDSWGRSYPEQFGCPPYDPTAKYSSGF